MYSFIKYVKFFVGGGIRKYRVNGNRVEMKGGGCGPFWGFAHFSDIENSERAEFFARRWAKQNNGIFCGKK